MKLFRLFIIKILLFFAIIVIIDQLFGYSFSHLVKAAKSGDTRRNEYICHELSSDILIFGSSRASHHYNPIIISDSLGYSCYNCGQDGNGIILNYGFSEILPQRYTPKFIIYDITPNYDLLKSENNSKYLGMLRPYYNENRISKLFEAIDTNEKYKMISNLYRYNSKFIQIVSDNINVNNSEGLAGFSPIDKKLDTLKIRNKREICYEIDSVKIKYLNKFIDNFHGTIIVFCISPIWYGMDTKQIEPIKSKIYS